ncbi:MAG: hypothetical protein ABR600_10860 [Actinomycetota bacterium]
MTAPQIVWLAVGVTGACGLLAVVIGLFRQVKRLGRAVVEFGNEVRPTLVELRAEAERAQVRTERLARQGQALQEQRSRR